MDASKEYIDMCEKAKEIQILRGEGLWQNGDFYVCTTGRGLFKAWWTDTEDEPPVMFKPVWLPRQDQLFKMSEYKWIRTLSFLIKEI